MTIPVVLVEDSREILALVEELLTHVGPLAVVGRLGTEAEATQWIAEHANDWDLAIVDLVLRDGSGFNLLHRFREANPRSRIVVLSDYATTTIKVRCVELGADAVFTKGDIKAFTAYLRTWPPALSGERAVASATQKSPLPY